MTANTRVDADLVASKRIQTLASYARIVAAIGLLLFTGTLAYAVFACIFDPASVDAGLRDEFLEASSTATFTVVERILGLALLFIPTLFGVIALLSAINLFSGYRRGEIFTVSAAARLRLIGWMIVALAPATQIAQTIGTAVFSRLESPERVNLEVSFNDSDIYAIVFGLLIVVVGHVMYEATNLSDENRSFV